MCTGETPAKPVGDAGLLAPSGEERQFRAVAAHSVLAEVFGLPADIVGGGLHDGDLLAVLPHPLELDAAVLQGEQSVVLADVSSA